MLVSSGHFVNYRAEVHAFSLIGPKFGQLTDRRDRQRFLNMWLPSNYSKKTNLNRDLLRRAILDSCHSTADFLAVVMRLMAEAQGRRRWAECTPANVFYLKQIHAAFPRARFIHMVRDGRDVALSLTRQRWISPLPWDSQHRLPVAALFWQRNVSIGTRDGSQLGSAYREVRFEDLVRAPRTTLQEVAEFVEEDLDYDFITANPVGSVEHPNTSFGADDDFSPVGRWHEGMSDAELFHVERLIGNSLIAKDYQLSRGRGAALPAPSSLKRFTYKTIWRLRHWWRNKTVMGRFTDMELIRKATAPVNLPQTA